MIGDVLRQTGITATAGIGTNLYLCKVAMDIEAKHIPADKDGVRIAELDEMTYRQETVDAPSAEELLARGERHSQQALASNTASTRWATSQGQSRQERGTAIPVVRRQCRAADRPCLGMGALHDGIYKSL